MNAVVKQQEISSARSQLDATRAHIAGLAEKQQEPRKWLPASQEIVDRARAAEAAERDAARAWSDLEQRRLIGKPVDVKALQAAEQKHAEAVLVADGAKRKAGPAAAVIAQLSQQIAVLQAQISAEANRLPFLIHAVLIEQGRSGLDELREAVRAFAEAWTRSMAPFFAADTIALARENEQLGIAATLSGMAARVEIPMPFNVPGVSGGYIELARRELQAQAEQILAAHAASR